MTGAALNLSPFKILIKEKSGLCFEAEKAAALADGVRARMFSRGMASDSEYLACLLQDEAEFHSLVNLLTINETYFFREPVHLDLWTDVLLGEMLAARTPGEPIRILCAGCSTGEEPYSVMMKLLESYGTGIQGLVSLIGADIDSEALRKAEEGIYSGHSFRGFPAALREKYFEGAGNGRYRIRGEVRGKIRFMKLNLMDDAYPDALRGTDVIFYRNVSIYFEPATQLRIFNKLAGLLKDDGWLFVSATETLSHRHGTLALVERNGIFCYQKKVEIALGDRRMQPPQESAATKRSPAAAAAGSAAAGSAAASRLATAALRARPPATLAAPGPSPARKQVMPEARTDRASFDEALALAQSKRYQQALTCVDELLAREPSFIKGYMLKAGILINLQRLADAEQVCRRSMEIEPWYLEGHLLLGLIAKMANDHEAAARRFKEAVYIQSACWLAHFYLAEIHCARNEGKQAAREYEIVIRLLEKGDLAGHGLTFFPLAFPAGQIMHLCRHNLAKLSRDKV